MLDVYLGNHWSLYWPLASSMMLAIARVRTQWLLEDADGLAATLTASFAFKIALNSLEAIEKRHILLGGNNAYPLRRAQAGR